MPSYGYFSNFSINILQEIPLPGFELESRSITTRLAGLFTYEPICSVVNTRLRANFHLCK